MPQIYIFLRYGLISKTPKYNGKRLLATKNAFQFAAALAHGVVCALHQGGDVGIRKAEQIRQQ